MEVRILPLEPERARPSFVDARRPGSALAARKPSSRFVNGRLRCNSGRGLTSRPWSNSKTRACQARDPGAIPGSRTARRPSCATEAPRVRLAEGSPTRPSPRRTLKSGPRSWERVSCGFESRLGHRHRQTLDTYPPANLGIFDENFARTEAARGLLREHRTGAKTKPKVKSRNRRAWSAAEDTGDGSAAEWSRSSSSASCAEGRTCNSCLRNRCVPWRRLVSYARPRWFDSIRSDSRKRSPTAEAAASNPAM